MIEEIEAEASMLSYYDELNTIEELDRVQRAEAGMLSYDELNAMSEELEELEAEAINTDISAHLFEADMLADTAQEIESGRHKLANGLRAKYLAPAVRDVLADEFWAASHGLHEWLNRSHGVPMTCACPLWCAPKVLGGAQ